MDANSRLFFFLFFFSLAEMSRNDRSLSSNSIEEGRKFISGENTTLQAGFENACASGRVELVKWFLALPQIDVNKGLDASFRWSQHVAVVKLLLADERFTLSSDHQRTFAMSALFGHVDALQLFLADGRFDPSIQNDGILDSTLSSYLKSPYTRAPCLKSAELLLADERVLISLPQSKHRILQLCEAAVFHPRIGASLLLKRSFRQYVLSYTSETKADGEDDECDKAQEAKLVAQITQDLPMKEVLSIEKKILSCLDVYLISDLSVLCVDYLPDYLACFHLLDLLSFEIA
jgi:hypothetical protein